MGAAMHRTKSAATFLAPSGPAPTETRGKSGSLACLNAAIDAWCAQTCTSKKTLADQYLQCSEGQFSKLCSGQFRVELLDRLPAEIRVMWRDLLEQEDQAQGLTRDDVVLRRLQHAIIDGLEVVSRLTLRDPR